MNVIKNNIINGNTININNIIIENKDSTKNNNIISSNNFIINISDKNSNISSILEYKKNVHFSSPNKGNNIDSMSNSNDGSQNNNMSQTSSPSRVNIICIKPPPLVQRECYVRNRGKSLLTDAPKKECSICKKLIETHLHKFHVNSHPSQLFNWLFLGTFSNACDINELRRNNIKYILNCASECRNTSLPDDIKELHLNIRDEKGFDLIKFFDEANIFMNKVRMSGGVMLVHCKYGISRSATFIIAYLIKYFGFTVQSALKYIKNIRNQVKPNEGFLSQLMEYEKLNRLKEKQ